MAANTAAQVSSGNPAGTPTLGNLSSSGAGANPATSVPPPSASSGTGAPSIPDTARSPSTDMGSMSAGAPPIDPAVRGLDTTTGGSGGASMNNGGQFSTQFSLPRAQSTST
jgi:hypothetical protein